MAAASEDGAGEDHARRGRDAGPAAAAARRAVRPAIELDLPGDLGARQAMAVERRRVGERPAKLHRAQRRRRGADADEDQRAAGSRQRPPGRSAAVLAAPTARRRRDRVAVEVSLGEAEHADRQARALLETIPPAEAELGAAAADVERPPGARRRRPPADSLHAPRKARRASSCPLMISSGRPVSPRTVAANAAPSSASRRHWVPTAATPAQSCAAMVAAKRRSTPSVAAAAAADRASAGRVRGHGRDP